VQPSDKDQLRLLVTDACHHVLPACGIPVEGPSARTLEDARVERLAGFIGFSAERMLGTLIIIAPVELVRLSYPLPLPRGATCELELFDWFGEVANRLMGRMKSSIARHGIILQPSTPKVVLAEQLQTSASGHGVCDLCFTVRGSSIEVLVDGVSKDGSSLLQGALAEDESVAEGEILLFSMRPGGA
jgi:hypothetical protein